jgi:hypothetical protein
MVGEAVEEGVRDRDRPVVDFPKVIGSDEVWRDSFGRLAILLLCAEGLSIREGTGDTGRVEEDCDVVMVAGEVDAPPPVVGWRRCGASQFMGNMVIMFETVARGSQDTQ